MAKAEKFHKPNQRLIKNIGNRIRFLRREAGMTIEELSIKSNLNYKYLQRCETAKVNISVSVLYSITKGLKISLKEFFEEI